MFPGQRNKANCSVKLISRAEALKCWIVISMQRFYRTLDAQGLELQFTVDRVYFGPDIDGLRTNVKNLRSRRFEHENSIWSRELDSRKKTHHEIYRLGIHSVFLSRSWKLFKKAATTTESDPHFKQDLIGPLTETFFNVIDKFVTGYRERYVCKLTQRDPQNVPTLDPFQIIVFIKYSISTDRLYGHFTSRTRRIQDIQSYHRLLSFHRFGYEILQFSSIRDDFAINTCIRNRVRYEVRFASMISPSDRLKYVYVDVTHKWITRSRTDIFSLRHVQKSQRSDRSLAFNFKMIRWHLIRTETELLS